MTVDYIRVAPELDAVKIQAYPRVDCSRFPLSIYLSFFTPRWRRSQEIRFSIKALQTLEVTCIMGLSLAAQSVEQGIQILSGTYTTTDSAQV